MSRNKDNSSRYPKEGDTLCGYKFGHTLGQGAFGKVKLATKLFDPEPDTKYAVKFIDKSEMDDLDDVERIYRESAILTSLKHENIIRLYEVKDSQYHVLIVMEYANGGELKDFIQSKENHILPESLACDILNSTLSGLEYCHRRKVIHRDLKLENILIDTSGCIKIADFGLSNTAQFGTKMNTACGTPSYIAPEIINGSACAPDSKISGAECDIWSLGVILYTMICGFLPFQASNIKKLYNLILKGDYITPDYISEESKDLIKSMLTVDVEKRISLPQIRNHTWMTMRTGSLIDVIKKRPKPTAEQIKAAQEYCITRKKPQQSKIETKKIDVQNVLLQNRNKLATAFSSDEDQETVELKNGSSKRKIKPKPGVKHSKSLDRELAIYFNRTGKSLASPKDLKRARNRRKHAIDSIKNRLNKLKMGIAPNVSSKTPRNSNNSTNVNNNNNKKKKGNNKSLSKNLNNNNNRNNNKEDKKHKKEDKKNEKSAKMKTPTKKNKKNHLGAAESKNENLSTPNGKVIRPETFHSPIVDSIMKRKQNSQSWNIELDYPELASRNITTWDTSKYAAQ